MRKMAPLSLLLSASLLMAGCNSDDTTTPVTPAAPKKNVLFFLGDGMGITTLTASRIYSVGEDGNLTIDTLPETAYLKTYSNDSQVTDSAPSMAAYMTGVKSNNGVIAMDSEATQLDDCSASKGKAVTTLLELAKKSGMGTGVVTSTRVTHATPAATYAHICNRDLENDIAVQAVPGGTGFNSALGDGLDVILGGGRKQFLPSTALKGGRSDNRDLVAELKALGYNYAASKDELAAADSSKRLIGLFNDSHLSYDLDRANGKAPTEPSLTEMTTKAIEVLSKKDKGFFLMVEGGRIDHALHDTNAKRALQDTVAFDNALKAAIDQMKSLDPDLKNTLIVVTADHDHTMTFNGYSAKGNNILDLVKEGPEKSIKRDINGNAITTLAFGNGPTRKDTRTDLTSDQVTADDYLQETGVKLGSETHGGGDVMLFASGPNAELFKGTIDNTAVFAKVKSALGL